MGFVVRVIDVMHDSVEYESRELDAQELGMMYPLIKGYGQELLGEDMYITWEGVSGELPEPSPEVLEANLPF